MPPVTLAEEAGQEVLPGRRPRLHPPAFSIFLRPYLNHLICSFCRRRAERDLPETLKFVASRFGYCRAALTGLCQVALAV